MRSMMKVKICGITRVEDAVYAESQGADAIGVVVCSESPREVTLDEAEEIFMALGPFSARVCVTHTKSTRELEEILAIEPDAIQIFHPFEVPDIRRCRVIRVLEPGGRLRGDCDAVAIDESMGQGKLYDEAVALDIVRRSVVPVILCGGLTPANVAEAVRTIGPYAVDVCTGVEKAPGRKEPALVRAFISAAKGCPR